MMKWVEYLTGNLPVISKIQLNNQMHCLFNSQPDTLVMDEIQL